MSAILLIVLKNTTATNLEHIIIALLASFGSGFLIALYIITHWKNIRLFLADFLTIFRFLGKHVRKVIVEERYEGVINGAINDFNSNFDKNIVPNCRLKWLNVDTQESYFEDGKAIICLKLDKKDEDLNFYNATYSYTKTGFFPNTRNFVKQPSQKAIDLNITKKILKDYNRQALRIFNQKYREEEEIVKHQFSRFEQTENRGLFSSLLIPELYYLGDVLGTKTPDNKIEQEIEDFFNWFYDLATREKDEETILNYCSTHIRVGVILVANLDTYRNYGLTAYTKWAEKYASENYGAVYLLARGDYRTQILKEVANDLTESKGFDQITKKTTTFETIESGEKVLITCICLKPNLSKIQYHAWDKLDRAYSEKKQVQGIIKSLNIDSIIVNVFGLDFRIDKKNLSESDIPTLNKYFFLEQELLLNISSLDKLGCLASFNNLKTDTDPKVIIDAALQGNTEYEVIVDEIKIDKDGQEIGLKTFCKAIKRKVFIPKKHCSQSRFVNLSKSFAKDTKLKVILRGFSLEYANFFAEIANLINPWDNINNFKITKKYRAIIQEISESYITTELLPGLECRIYKNELSWGKDFDYSSLVIGSEIEILLLNIDQERLHITGSLKRINKSSNEIFYEKAQSTILKATVLKVFEGFGLKFSIDDHNRNGFVYISELIWGFCSDIELNFPVDSPLEVIPIGYDFQSNEIRYSVKRRFQNDFESVKNLINYKEVYKGKIIRHFIDLARVELRLNGFLLQCYIHKSEISNIEYINSEDIPKFLPINNEFSFYLKRKDEKNEIVELSRKKFLSENKPDLDFDETYSVQVVKKVKSYAFFYIDEFEGSITENYSTIKEGDSVEVFPIRSGGPYSI